MGRGPGEAAPHMAVNDDGIVEAAGGVVTRTGPRGGEVLVVHRPKYDDWSLPKGKLDPGETAETAAVREVEEETGWTCTLGQELTTVRYQDRNGRPKRVRYWTMTAVSDRPFVPNAEVDEVVWIPLAEAATLLTYDADRRVLARLGEP